MVSPRARVALHLSRLPCHTGLMGFFRSLSSEDASGLVQSPRLTRSSLNVLHDVFMP